MCALRTFYRGQGDAIPLQGYGDGVPEINHSIQNYYFVSSLGRPARAFALQTQKQLNVIPPLAGITFLVATTIF